MPAVASLSDFIGQILEINKDEDEVLMFRGHADKSFVISPSVFREKRHKEKGHELLREVIIAHPTEFASDPGTFDKLVRAQHYSLPTRLLDVSLNPLVALFLQPKTARTGRLRL